ncbi:hypothetical protein [Halobacteriovorax sp. DA5]|uniref:hypothetical protein n=1 Tax=Halobacteriovorax sp. DA5 TaxID=2067553 RepID=UPI000CD13ACD|nr:hypothetical protein [Halobacteriovorax sp. DA5]POB13601.1 hypothetical protein C0Z22_10580 [Halobacteriovorax sp. DA5]
MSNANEPSLKSKRAGIVFGFVISFVLGSAFVFSALKAGITPGISPLVVLFGWVAMGTFFKDDMKGFLAMAQVTGSAGVAVTAGVAFVAPIVQILAAELGVAVPPVDILSLILASAAGCFLGWGFVGLATQRFLTDPKLPAPEAVACDRLIQTAAENPQARPPLKFSLIPGLAFGFVMAFLSQIKVLKASIYDLKFTLSGVETKLPLPINPLYFGIGALLTVPTAILIFFGGLLNAVVKGMSAAQNMPGTTFRWVGGAAMVVAVVYSLIAYIIEGRKTRNALANKEADFDAEQLEIPASVRKQLLASIGFGAFLLIAMMLYSGATLVGLVALGIVALLLIFFLSGLGALLSLQVGSSASPVSGTVFMGMLVLSLVGLAIGLEGIEGVYFLVPIIVAACVAICASNDSSQDYKTMQFNGLKVSSSFIGQLVGLLGGAISVPLAVYVAHETGTLGSEALPAPQAAFFATVLKSLFIQSDIPMMPVLAGAGLGLLAVIIEIIGKRKGIILSSLAFAVGIYLPSYIGTGILLGSLARLSGTKSVTKITHRGILTAAGLITGDALFALLFGILAIGGMEIAGVEGFNYQTSLSVLFFVGLLLTTAINYAKTSSIEKN